MTEALGRCNVVCRCVFALWVPPAPSASRLALVLYSRMPPAYIMFIAPCRGPRPRGPLHLVPGALVFYAAECA